MPQRLILKLTRTHQSPDGTFGTLIGPGLSLVTMEDDWLGNAPGKSCIPDGRYVCKRTIFYKHNIETFEVTGVKGRSRILIHVANTEEDVEGCIGIGMRYGKILVKRDEDTGVVNVLKEAVVVSQTAFQRFINYTHDVDEFDLIVEWGPGLPKEKV